RVLTPHYHSANPRISVPSVVAFSQDGKAVAASSRQGHIQVWDTFSGKARLSFNVGEDDDRSSEEGIVSLVFTPDSKALITGDGGRVSMWDAATGKHLHPFATPEQPDPDDHKIDKGYEEQMVAISPDVRLLAAGGRSPHTLRVWEVSSRKLR